MIDVERFSDLPVESRISWSSRPVWDRRTPATHRLGDRRHLGVAGCHRRRNDRRTHHPDRFASLVGKQPLVGHRRERSRA